MMIAQLRGTVLVPIRTERKVTRLAADFRLKGSLSEEAVQKTLDTVLEYSETLRQYEADPVACGATGVVRLASNSSDLIDEIAGRTGIAVEILSEEREAFLSIKGMLSVLPPSDGDFLGFDIGGGSTEFLLVRSRASRPSWCASIPIGAATLTESHLGGDPPGRDAQERASAFVREKIIALREQMLSSIGSEFEDGFPAIRLAGTAGTVTTLAAIHLRMTEYIPYRVNGVSIEAEWLRETVESLSGMPISRRKSIPGLEPGREDIILGGAIIASQILSTFGKKSFLVTDAGLLEGLLLERVEKESGLASGLNTSLTWQLQKG